MNTTHKRSCNELGLCQAQFGAARCASCDLPAQADELRLAPGVIHRGEPTFDEMVRQRHREALKRNLKGAAWWFGFVLLSGLAAGLIAGVNP